MVEPSQMVGELGQIIVTVDPLTDLRAEVPSSRELLAHVEEHRDELAAELSLSFEPLRGTLVPGELEIREGSVRIILHVLGDIAQWTAVAAGVWQMFEYLRLDIANRVRRFLERTTGLRFHRVTTAVVPVAVFPSAPGATPGVLLSANSLQYYLLLSHAVLLISLVGVVVALLVKVL